MLFFDIIYLYWSRFFVSKWKKTQPFSGAKIVGYIFLLHTWDPWRHVWRRLCLDGYDLWGFSAETRSRSAEWVFLEKSTASLPLNPWMGKEDDGFSFFLGQKAYFQGRCLVSFREGSIWRISDFLYFVGGVLSENFQSLGLELRFLFWMYPAENQHILF